MSRSFSRHLNRIRPFDTKDNITGEAKHEAIEQLLDKGYLRLKIGPRNRRGQFKYYMELWNGQSYQMVGRGRSR